MNKTKIFCWLWEPEWAPKINLYYPSSDPYYNDCVYYDLISKKYIYYE